MSIEKNDLDINISRRAKMARSYAGIDQHSAAMNLSISVVTLSRYENGKRPVGSKTAIKMSELYGVSVDWLLTGEGPMQEIYCLVKPWKYFKNLNHFRAVTKMVLA